MCNKYQSLGKMCMSQTNKVFLSILLGKYLCPSFSLPCHVYCNIE